MNVFVCLSACMPGGEYVDRIVKYIVEYDHHLIYGGGKRGAMGQLSSTLHSEHPEVKQTAYTIPKYVSDVPYFTDEVFVCDTLLDRVKCMTNVSDVAIVCPGGLGTAQELLTLLEFSRTSRRIPIVVINDNGRYNWFVDLVDNWISTSYASADLKDYFLVVDKFDATAVQYLSK